MARARLVQELKLEEVVTAASLMEVPNLAEVIEELPGDLSEAILGSLAPKDREQKLAHGHLVPGRNRTTHGFDRVFR